MTASTTNRVLVPASHGASLLVRKNEMVAVVDVEGGQVGDLFAFNAMDTSEFASASHTRVMLARLFPRPGDAIFSDRRRPMLALTEDSSPGIHDALYAACDQRRYELLGAGASHRSCAMNLAEAMIPHGGLRVPVPQPFNVFMDVRSDQHGVLTSFQASSQAGDRLVFRAVMDCIVVLSSCPMDLVPISRSPLTSLALHILGSDPSSSVGDAS